MNGQAESLNPLTSVRSVKVRTGIKTGRLTQKRLKEVLHYDPESGVFRWKVALSRRTRVGSLAGTIDADGYRTIRIEGINFFAHRLAVLYMEGYMPELSVDHISRIKDDNRYKSLREASGQCQMRNIGIRKDNISGVKGVHWNKSLGKWKAYITIDKRSKHLGVFVNIIDAAYVRFAAEQCLGFQDCDINSSAKHFINNFKHSGNKK